MEMQFDGVLFNVLGGLAIIGLVMVIIWISAILIYAIFAKKIKIILKRGHDRRATLSNHWKS